VRKLVLSEAYVTYVEVCSGSFIPRVPDSKCSTKLGSKKIFFNASVLNYSDLFLVSFFLEQCSIITAHVEFPLYFIS
jgi:hypothetical protein